MPLSILITLYFKNVFSYNKSKVKYIVWLKEDWLRWTLWKWYLTAADIQKWQFQVVQTMWWFCILNMYIFFTFLLFVTNVNVIWWQKNSPLFLGLPLLKNSLNSIAHNSNLLKSNFNLHFHPSFLIPFSTLRSNPTRWYII